MTSLNKYRYNKNHLLQLTSTIYLLQGKNVKRKNIHPLELFVHFILLIIVASLLNNKRSNRL